MEPPPSTSCTRTASRGIKLATSLLGGVAPCRMSHLSGQLSSGDPLLDLRKVVASKEVLSHGRGNFQRAPLPSLPLLLSCPKREGGAHPSHQRQPQCSLVQGPGGLAPNLPFTPSWRTWLHCSLPTAVSAYKCWLPPDCHFLHNILTR